MFKKIIIIFYLISNNLLADEYFLTLRNEKVNLRQGPSFEYPIKIFYKKKYLPVLIEDKSDNFKRIRDHENNSGWIHVSQLSKKKAGITIKDDLLIFDKPTIYSKPLVVLKKGRLCIVKKCKGNWCKVKVDEYVGWIKKDDLWGRL
ncbi:MAG: SH3 domain-containing protein [Pelagibacteraceae bacterium]